MAPVVPAIADGANDTTTTVTPDSPTVTNATDENGSPLTDGSQNKLQPYSDENTTTSYSETQNETTTDSEETTTVHKNESDSDDGATAPNSRTTNSKPQTDRDKYIISFAAAASPEAHESPKELKDRVTQQQAGGVSHLKQLSGVTVGRQLWITNEVAIYVNTSKIPLPTVTSHDDIDRAYKPSTYDRPDPEEPSLVEVGTSSTQTNDYTYGLEQINVPELRERFAVSGDGVKVAILDTGVNPDHAAITLSGDQSNNYEDGWAVFNDRTMPPWSTYDTEGSGAPTPYDSDGHGTHVSGTATGDKQSTQYGVAPQAELMHANVFNDNGVASYDSVIAGIEWAYLNDADVISMSLGGQSDSSLIDPIATARSNDAIVVAASGNDGAGTINAPADINQAISVGASDRHGNIVSFSSGEQFDPTDRYGSDVSNWKSPQITPYVSAPGNSVLSADYTDPDGTTYLSGTSMAAPHVAGTAALLRDHNPSLTDEKIESVLAETAVQPSGYSKPNTRSGRGIIDAEAALQATTPGGFVTVESTGGPTAADRGEDITLTTTLKNMNTLGDTATREVTLRRDGTQIDTRQVTLTPTESVQESFDVSVPMDALDPLTYTINATDETFNRSVTVNPEFIVQFAEEATTDPMVRGEQARLKATVTNIGGQTGDGVITLDIGGQSKQQTATGLSPDESQTVTFTYTPTESDGDSLSPTVTTQDGNDSMTVPVADPTAFSITIDDKAIRDPLIKEQSETIPATISNVGDIERSTLVTLSVNSTQEESTTTPTLAGGESHQVTFDYTPSEVTNSLTFDITTDDQTETVSREVVFPSDFDVSVDTASIRSPLIDGYAEDIPAIIKNTGGRSDTATTRLLANGTQVDTVSQRVSPSTNESVTLSYTPQTGGDGVNLTVTTSDDTTKILRDVKTPGTFDVTIDAANVRSPILTNMTETIGVEVANTGQFSNYSTIQLYADETKVGEATTTDIQPGSSQQLTLEYAPTATATATGVNLRVESPDTTDTVSRDVVEPPFFETNITHAPTNHDRIGTAIVGTDTSVEYNITNTGGEAAQQDIAVTVGGKTITSQSVRIGPAESHVNTVTVPVDQTSLGSITPIVTSSDTTDTAQITTTDTPGTVENVGIVESGTTVNDTATVSATVSDSFGIETVEAGLAAEFIQYDSDPKPTTDSGDSVTASITSLNVAAAGDGTYTPYVVVTDVRGETWTLTNTTQTVTFDTTPPRPQLGLSNLGKNPATLTVNAAEQIKVKDISITANGNTRPVQTTINDAYITEESYQFDGGTVGEETDYTVDVTVGDTVGNTEEKTLTSTVLSYEIENQSGEVDTEATPASFNVSATDSIESQSREAKIYETETLPPGKSTEDNKVTGSFFQVNDIGLSDSELEEAKIRYPVSKVDIPDASTDELVILFDDDNGGYEPIETEIEDGHLVATVDGFSGGAPGVIDDDPPTIDTAMSDIGTEADFSATHKANITFEYSPTTSDIDPDTIDVSVSGTQGTAAISSTKQQATVNITGLSSSDDVEATLSVADTANNSATATVSIADTSGSGDEDDTTDNSGSSSSSSGTTGGGGGGAGGLGNGAADTEDSDPPDIANIRSTASLITPDATIETETNSDSVVTPDESETISKIDFHADVDTPVTVTDYGSPPTTLAEDIVASAQADGVDIDTDDAILAFSRVETELPPTADESAIVALTVNQDDVRNPESLAVVKETYSFAEQSDVWVSPPTSVVASSGETVTIETEVDSSSMLTVVEKATTDAADTRTNSSSEAETQTGGADSSPETDDSTPLGAPIPVLAVVCAAYVFRRQC